MTLTVPPSSMDDLFLQRRLTRDIVLYWGFEDTRYGQGKTLVTKITAETGTGVVMGLQHRTAPLCGVQFHPESVLTEGGYQMLGNWLESLGMAGAAERAADLSPLIKH